jgi:DNA-binding response OmpR family regulator
MTARILPRIAVIHDDRYLRDTLESDLERRGFAVRTAANGASALALIQSWEPEAIVLDATLPVVDSYSVLALVRSFSRVPILLAPLRETNRVPPADRPDGPAAKRSQPARLATRIRNALRSFPASDTQLRCSDLILDLELRTAWRGLREIRLSKREFDLVATLLKRPRHVFTRDELLGIVWGHRRKVMPGTVETYISYVRAKIDVPPARPLIQTVRGIGYTIRHKSF